jgi:hypothetical protein
MAGRHIAAAVMVLLTATACTARPSTATGSDVEQSPIGSPPAADFTATIDESGGDLFVNYRFVNRSGEDLIVLDRLPAWPDKPIADAVYVAGINPPGRVELAKRAFARPELGEAYREPTISGVILTNGQSTSEQLSTPLPLRREFPYGMGGELPARITDVVFCLGVIRRAELPPGGFVRDGVVSVPHESTTTAVQYRFCSRPFVFTRDRSERQQFSRALFRSRSSPACPGRVRSPGSGGPAPPRRAGTPPRSTPSAGRPGTCRPTARAARSSVRC